VPHPVAVLLLDYLDERTNMRTATNRESRWLLPGRRAGQPDQPSTLSARIHALGVPATAGRAAAIRQHMLDMPAPGALPRGVSGRHPPDETPPSRLQARVGPFTDGAGSATGRAGPRQQAGEHGLARGWMIAGRPSRDRSACSAWACSTASG
jgi:hypothetical protein